MRSLNESETIVKNIWPLKLYPLTYGCDFLEETGNFVEVKTNVFSSYQVNDLLFKFLEDKRSHLVVLDNGHILFFRLEKIQAIDGSDLSKPVIDPPETRRGKPQKPMINAKKTSLQIEKSMMEDIDSISEARGIFNKAQIIRMACAEHIRVSKESGEIE